MKNTSEILLFVDENMEDGDFKFWAISALVCTFVLIMLFLAWKRMHWLKHNLCKVSSYAKNMVVSVKNQWELLKDDYEKSSINENDSKTFEYVLASLAAFGSISYAIYNFYQTNPINNFNHGIITLLISAVLIFLIFNILYIVLKGLALGILDPKKRCVINLISSKLYLFNIIISSVLILSLIYVISAIYGAYTGRVQYYLIFGLILVILIEIISYIAQSLKKIELISLLSVLIIVIAVALNPLSTNVKDSTLLLGHITVDMENIYYKSDTRIPVPIKITGPNVALTIKLLQKNSTNPNKNYSIDRLGPQPNYKIEPSNTLTGYALGNGEYIVYINSSNLPTGYYKLYCERPDYNQSYTAKVFYLSEEGGAKINIIFNNDDIWESIQTGGR